MKKTKVINLYGGPGTGKSTIAAGVFSALKLDGINAEYIQEYAKDKAWEHGKQAAAPKVLMAQEYVFAKQHFRMRRCEADVDVMVCDSPLMMGHIYIPPNFDLPSLGDVITEAYLRFDNLNIFLKRGNRTYNPNGRFQSYDEAVAIDKEIRLMLIRNGITFVEIETSKDAAAKIVEYAKDYFNF